MLGSYVHGLFEISINKVFFLHGVGYSRQRGNIAFNCFPSLLWRKYVYVKHVYYIEFFQGGKINVSIRRTLIYKFQTEISESHVYIIQNFNVTLNSGIYRTTHHPYKINFQFGTKVSLLHANLVPNIKPQYTPLSLLTTTGFDTDYLVGKLIFIVFVPFFCIIIYCYVIYF